MVFRKHWHSREIAFGQVDSEAHPYWGRGGYTFGLNSKLIFNGPECVSKFA